MQTDKLTMIEILTGVRSSRKNYYVELQGKIDEVEKKSKKLEERFVSAIDLLPDGFEIYSPIRNDEDRIGDFQIDYVNDSMCKRFKTAKEQLLGRCLSELLSDHEMFSLYCKVAETGEPVSLEQFKYDKNRNIISVCDVRVVKIDDGIAILSRDVTDRKKNEEALKLAEERFSKAFHASPHLMAIHRESDNRCIDVNQRFLSVMGLSRQELIGRTPLEMDIDKNEYDRVMKLLDELGSLDNIQLSMPTKNGTLTFLVSAQKIEMNGEQCLLYALNDISEIKRLQIELARLDRLNLVGQMAAGLGHEIRNPMTVVRGYLQLLGAKPEFESQRSTFETMICELDRANSIISEYLSLARNRPTEKQCHNINDILRDLYPLLEADTFTQNKQIVFEAEETPDIQLDAKEISQLVLNLCRNGLDAMHERGILTIRTYVEGEHLVLSVQDEGCGISIEYLDKLGTPFFTTKENGTGLGLATCYSIANQHNARIDVDSCNSGTTFVVRFPCLANNNHK